MNAQPSQTEQFEQNRPHLRAVAYRMLGSGGEADDAVQEAWLRMSRSDIEAVENLRGWLTTVISRICLDMLRSRRARHEEPLDGPLPEPAVALHVVPDPEQEALMADAVGSALLVVLETLSPAERLAFVLHDMFGVPFDEIAPIVERSVDSTRQLASRARRRVRGAEPEGRAESLAAQRAVVEAFLAASRHGDFDQLVAVLDPDVVFRSDRVLGGAPGPAGIAGNADVAKLILKRGAPFAHLARPVLVDGRAGVVVVLGGRVLSVVAFTVQGRRVTAIDLTLDPEILQRIEL
jgi:RNA polymerase sigma-70 factor (ECF subfamily)